LGSIGLLFVIGGYQASGKDASYGGMIFVGLLLLAAAAISVSTRLITKNATEVAASNKRVLIKTGMPVLASLFPLLTSAWILSPQRLPFRHPGRADKQK
jgi:hypothetical protein